MDDTQPPGAVSRPVPLTRIPRASEGRHFVYVLRSCAGEILYIGVTSNLPERIGAHCGERRVMMGWCREHSLALEFVTRADAYAHEQEAIGALRPPWNNQGTGGRGYAYPHSPSAWQVVASILEAAV